MQEPAAPRPAAPREDRLPGVRRVLAVSAGKGGVGKSTTAVNLALALSDGGARVGLLDADVLGPSVRSMLGAEGPVRVECDGHVLHPIECHGVRMMGVDLLVPDSEAPLIWRGAMASQVLDQMLRKTVWGDLDVLVIDMPPGTGDVPLSLCQRAPLDGALIVTTPQDVALLDVARGVGMFRKADVPLLGVLDNMAVHVCEACGHASHPFGQGGADRLAATHGLTVLARLPLDLSTRQQADTGVPVVRACPDGAAAQRYRALAQAVMQALASQAGGAVDRAASSSVQIEWSTHT